jgi:hypothetical protein
MDTAPLAGWDNFYVIVGSSAGGLTGLTFVVIALVSDATRVVSKGLKLFVTPTIVHFAAVLALSAFMSVPHQGLLSLSAGLAVGGVAGLAYSGFIAASIRGMGSTYVPVLEDWLGHVFLPGLAYACLIAGAILIWRWPGSALCGVAAASLLLLFVGIHNAWDIAVWTTLNRGEAGQAGQADSGGGT